MPIPGEIKGPKHLAPGKLQQILAAGQQQLSSEEFDELLQLVEDFYAHGVTNWINCRLGELISKLDWELDISESAEWHKALCACDEAYLLKELKALCYELGLGAGGHKKLLCRKLYMVGYEPVVAIMQPIIDRIEAGEEVEEKEHVLAQTEPVSQLGNLGEKLEEMRRSDPEKFYRRHRELIDFISQLQR